MGAAKLNQVMCSLRKSDVRVTPKDAATKARAAAVLSLAEALYAACKPYRMSPKLPDYLAPSLRVVICGTAAGKDLSVTRPLLRRPRQPILDLSLPSRNHD
jgi:hypothetical protein